MTVQPTIKIDPDDMVRYLLYQQFYYGDDNIYGRTKDKFEHIEREDLRIWSVREYLSSLGKFFEISKISIAQSKALV